MTGPQLILILPYLVLAASAVAVLLAIAVRRHHDSAAWICAIGLICAFASLFVAASRAPQTVTPLFVIDGYALFYTGLLIAAALGVTMLSHRYLRTRSDLPEEYYALLLLATLGAAALVASDHFASFFLALETLSISLLGLIAYTRVREQPTEAGIKYLILSGLSSALLLFGIALLYNEFGTLAFTALALEPARIIAGHTTAAAMPGLFPQLAPHLAALAGVALVLVGLGFKLSVVPFHLWAPDVYEGAPAPVSAFIAVVSKCAVVALLLRYVLAAGVLRTDSLHLAITVMAVLSIMVGNLLGLLQDNIKRLLAYSSIAHLGYVLVALLAGGTLAIEAVSAYLVAYAIMTLGAFGVVTVLSRPEQTRDADTMQDYQGLFWTRPALAMTFTIMLLSLAGIPMTLGFIAKFYAVTAGVGAQLTAAVTALVVGSIIGLYYYLRVIVAMLKAAAAPDAPPSPTALPTAPPIVAPRPERRVGFLAGAAMAVLLILLLGLGVYPSPLLGLIRLTTSRVSPLAAPVTAGTVQRAADLH